MQETCGDVDKNVDNSHSGMARKLTKSRKVTPVTSNPPPPRYRSKISVIISVSRAGRSQDK